LKYSDLSFLGDKLENELAIKICTGLIDPNSHKIFEDLIPEVKNDQNKFIYKNKNQFAEKKAVTKKVDQTQKSLDSFFYTKENKKTNS